MAVAYVHDGRTLITAESRRYLRVRRADTGAVLATILMPETARTPRVFVLPGDHVVVTCSADGLVRSWDLASGTVLDAFEAEPLGNILAAALSPDGEEFVTGGAAGTVHVWRLARGRAWRLLDHPGDDGDYGDAAYSEGGTRIVTGDIPHVVTEWNAASGAPLRSFRVRGYAERVIPVLGGARVAVLPWEPDGLPAHVWDLATGASTATLPSPQSRLAMGRASPDGRTQPLRVRRVSPRLDVARDEIRIRDTRDTTRSLDAFDDRLALGLGNLRRIEGRPHRSRPRGISKARLALVLLRTRRTRPPHAFPPGKDSPATLAEPTQTSARIDRPLSRDRRARFFEFSTAVSLSSSA